MYIRKDCSDDSRLMTVDVLANAHADSLAQALAKMFKDSYLIMSMLFANAFGKYIHKDFV